MDRLTWQPPNYYGYFTPKDGIEGMDCVQKLAAYEDTGLTPAEVAELAQAKADGRVVAYGEWLNFVGDYSTAECSQCENIYEVSPDEKPCEDYFNAFKQFYKYCPNCGAKMDKESESNGE